MLLLFVASVGAAALGLVQTHLPHRRKPIYNAGFDLFTIAPQHYTFRGAQYPSACRVTDVACHVADTLRLLLEHAHHSFYYLIEDDTYFCGPPETLYELMALRLPVICTGIGGTGLLISRVMLELLVRERRPQPGLDLLLSSHYANYTYRYYSNLNIHMLEGSVIGNGDSGRVTNVMPTCFEFACQNEGYPGAYDYYNFADCDYVVHQAGAGKQCTTSVPRVVHRPICAHFCKRRCAWQRYKLLND